MAKATYVCLSDREFENKQYHYDFIDKFVSNCKPQGMWFSLPSENEEYESTWHEFLCSGYISGITRFCDEDGITSVIKCQIKDNSFVVSSSNIVDELKKVINEDSTDETNISKRQKLLNLVRQKYNMPAIEHVILNVDGSGIYGLKNILIPNTEERKKRRAFSEITNCFFKYPSKIEAAEKEFGIEYKYYIPKGYNFDITDVHKDILDILEEFVKGTSVDEIFSKYPPTRLRYFANLCKSTEVSDLLFELEEDEEYSSKFNKYFRDNRTWDMELLFQDEEFIALIGDDFRKRLAQTAESLKGIPKHVIEEYRKMFEESSSLGEINEKINRNYPIEKSDAYMVAEGITECFSGMVNNSFCGDDLDMPSLAVFDTGCIQVISQEHKKLFTREQIIDAINKNIEILKERPEYGKVIKSQIDKLQKNFYVDFE